MNAKATTLRVLALAGSLLLLPTLAAPPATAGSTTCPAVSWGSLLKTSGVMTTQALTNIRTGQHACYDRIVFDIGSGSGGKVGYRVSYGTVYTEGKGDPVPLAGAADLRIVILAPAYNASGRPTYDPATVPGVTGYRTFRDVKFAGTFEGQTTVGLGVRARLPMRAFVLSGPGSGQRLVVDVAHQWTAF